MVDTGSAPLGSVEVEVKANLDQLVRDFGRARAQTQAFGQSMAGVTGQATKFQDNMVTVNRAVQQAEAAQIRANATWSTAQKTIEANANAMALMTRATNPTVASTRLVTSALRDVEAAYRNGTITSGALAKAQQMALPYISRTSDEYESLVKKFDPLKIAQQRYSADLAGIAQAEQAGLLTGEAANSMRSRAAKSFEDLEKKVEGNTVGLAGWARSTEHHLRAMRLLMTFVGVDVVARFGEFAVKTLETTAALGDQARQLGVTTAELQEYRAIAGQVGMSSGDMDKAMEHLGQTIKDMSLGKVDVASKLFKRLHVDIKDTAGEVRPTTAIFNELIDKLGQVGNEAQRRGAQTIAFGEAGAKMGQLIEQGSGGIDKLRQAVRDMGLVLSDKQIAEADKTAKKLDLVGQALKIQLASTVVENAQAISQLATALESVAAITLTSAVREIGSLIDRIVQLGQAVRDFQSFLNSLDPTGQSGKGRDELGTISDAIGSYNYGTKPSTGMIGEILRGYHLEAPLESSVTVKLPPATPAGKPKPKGPNINLSGLESPKSPKGKQPKFDTFEQDMDAEKIKQLQLEREATGDLAAQNEIDKNIIAIQLDQELEKIKRQKQSKQLTVPEAKQLTLAAKNTALMEAEAADRKLRVAQIEQQAQYATEVSNLEREGLQIARAMARTDDERKRLDLAILDSTQQQAASDLQTEIAKAEEAKDSVRVAQLTEELAKLRANQLKEISQFNIDHLLGIDKFKNDLPKTLAEFQDAIHHLSFDLFNQKLQEAAQFADDIGGAFGKAAGALARFENPLDVLRGLLSDLAATFTKNFIEKPVSDWITAHVGMPLAKQGFGGDLDKLAKAAGGTALTTTEMNTALASATVSLTALTAAANAAAAAMAAGGGGGGGAGGLFASLLGGGGSGIGSGLFDFSSSMDLGLGGLDLGGDLGGNLLGETFSLGFAGGGFTGSGADHEIAGPVHRNEYVWDAPTTRQWMPVLQLIGSGKLPSFQGPGLGQMMGRGAQGGQPLTVQFGDVHLHGVTDERIARQSANQFMSHVQRRTAHVVKKGLNN